MINLEDITLRLATDADLNIFGEEFDYDYSDYGDSVKAKVIEFKEKPIGLIITNYERPHRVYLGAVEILEEYRGQGVGALLLNNILLKAREQQKPVMLSVDEGLRAVSLYKRLGFVEDGEWGAGPGFLGEMSWRAENNGFPPIRAIGHKPPSPL